MERLKKSMIHSGITAFLFSSKDEIMVDYFIQNFIQNLDICISSNIDDVYEYVNRRKNRIIYIKEPIQLFLFNKNKPRLKLQLSTIIKKLALECKNNNNCIILKTFTHTQIYLRLSPTVLSYNSSFVCSIDDNKLSILKSRYGIVNSTYEINDVLLKYNRKLKLIQIDNATW